MSLVINRACDFCQRKRWLSQLEETHYEICDECKADTKSKPFLMSFIQEKAQMQRHREEMERLFLADALEGDEG